MDFFIFTVWNIKVPLTFQANYNQLYLMVLAGEEVDFVVFTIFSDDGHLEFLKVYR